MARYIGLDAHASSCTLAVLGPSGQRLGSHVVETTANALIEVLGAISGPRHLCFEEGTLANWLHEMLSPHVEQCVVAAVRESRGQKSDQRDAVALAEALRLGAVERQVYKGQGAFSSLRYRAKAHRLLVVDAVRVMNRIKSLLRSRSVTVSGKTVYSPSGRDDWIAQLPEPARPAAELLYLELDALTSLRERAEHELIVEARKHREFRLVSSCPGLGPIRTA